MMQWLGIIVPSFVSILGFLISFKTLKSSFQAEITKQKNVLQMDKMADIPFAVFDLMDYILGKQGKPTQKEQLERFAKIMNITYAYGSLEAVKIIAALQSNNYKLSKGDDEELRWKTFALYILLASQVKYDLTNVIISPHYWFRMKINDYTQTKETIKTACNSAIKELDLSRQFIIK